VRRLAEASGYGLGPTGGDRNKYWVTWKGTWDPVYPAPGTEGLPLEDIEKWLLAPEVEVSDKPRR
jgi:hypothetical protein